MKDAAIATRRLGRTFGRTEVLRALSLEVAKGEVLALVGKNGSGKSTLLEILATLLLPSAGEASVHGFDVVREAAAVRRLIGYSPSNPHSFYPRLSGRRNLEFFAALHGLNRDECRTRVDRLLAQVGIERSMDDRVERYSDGMKARLGVARALLASPPVLLLDEPTKSIDPAGREPIRSLILDGLRSGRTDAVLWVTHDLEEARAVADRVGILDEGQILETAPPHAPTPCRLAAGL